MALSSPDLSPLLKENASWYAHNDAESLESMRQREFSRLKDNVYLDHAGATLHSETQLLQCMSELNQNLFGNPHSHQSASSQHSTLEIESARSLVLSHFHADPRSYSVIFTSSATSALKLIGECFPWQKNKSHFAYHYHSHNSVLGIREYAAESGANFTALTESALETCFGNDEATIRTAPSASADSTIPCLFAYPLECNFSGAKYPLDWSRTASKSNCLDKLAPSASASSEMDNRKWYVLVDAAKAAATSDVDLSDSTHGPHFVVVSFYKIFGYPTGLGALLVRNDVWPILQKSYFGGGTVIAALADERFHAPRTSASGMYEDGTQNYLGIAALKHGFKQIERFSMGKIAQHTYYLARYVYEKMMNLKHTIQSGEGAVLEQKQVAVFYGKHHLNSVEKQGSILAFNLLRANGSFFGYSEVEKLANLHKIHLRTGCFCNPGACSTYLGLTNEQVLENLACGHVCWDDKDVINGRPTGAVRISFGYMSNIDDCNAFISFIEKYFVQIVTVASPSSALSSSSPVASSPTLLQCHIHSLYIYPVKSCGGVRISLEWPLSPTGFLYDREFTIIDAEGVALSQKKVPRLCLLRPSIDVDKNVLRISDFHNSSDFIEVPLQSSSDADDDGNNLAVVSLKVCADRVKARSCGAEASKWLTRILSLDCSLVRRTSSLSARTMRIPVSAASSPASSSQQHASAASQNGLSFSNEAPFLMITTASLRYLHQRIADADRAQLESDSFEGEWLVERFRPNIVLETPEGADAHIEDSFTSICIECDGSTPILLQNAGGCNRCSMICVNQSNGNLLSEPMSTLAGYRRQKGRILFGILLRFQDSESVGANVKVGAAAVANLNKED